jgi:hypothetical protein
MILLAGQTRLDLPPDAVAMLAMVHATGKGVRCRTPLMRCLPAWLDAMTGAERAQRGQPLYWCPRDGWVEVWPVPHEAFQIQARGRGGAILGRDVAAKPVAVVPVESYINAIAKAHQNDRQALAQPPRVERFSLLGEE